MVGQGESESKLIFSIYKLFQIGRHFACGVVKHRSSMRIFIGVVLWCLLLVVCWPLAIVMIFLFPLIWLILLPFRIVGFTIEAVFKLIGAILMFPFRLLKG